MARSRTSPPQDAVEGNGWVPPPLHKAPTLPPPRRRRRPALLALAVAMVVLGALGAAYLASSLGQTSSVIAVARPVPWGETITAADLAEKLSVLDITPNDTDAVYQRLVELGVDIVED